MSSSPFQKILYGIVVLFAVTAVGLAFMIWRQQEAVSNTYRYDISWSASQATTETARLGQAIGQFLTAPSESTLQGARQRFEILRSREDELRSGNFRDFVEGDPQNARQVQTFTDALDALDPLIARLDEPGVAGEALATIDPMNRAIALLASSASRYTSHRATEDRDFLQRLHILFSGLLLGLIVSGVTLIGVVSTVSRRQRDQNRKFGVTLDNMTQGICMFDRNERLTVWNDRLAAILEIDPSRLVRGKSIDEIAMFVSSGLLAADSLRPSGDMGSAALVRHIELQDGRTLSITQQGMESGGWVSTYEDVTERIQQEKRVSYLATHDELTELPNRIKFHDDLRKAIATTMRNGGHCALLCLDLNRFKAINDTLGHHIGDLLLQGVASRLSSAVGRRGTVARLGGDEFAIVQHPVADASEIDDLASRIVETIREPFDLAGHRVLVEVSIGVSIVPRDSIDPEKLMRNADLALYRSKAKNEERITFFDAAMETDLQKRLAREIDLRTAIEENAFELYFQPIVVLSNPSKITCYETLLRWKHPEHGFIPPDEFISLAEEIGLIVPLGAWVVQEACRQAASWNTKARVAVNISAVQFKQDDIFVLVRDALESSGLPANRLEIEVTENILIDNVEAAQRTLERLKDLGVFIAMDDFGTGYSSLSYLSKFPFDKIKIDRSFVLSIETQKNWDIIGTISTLGRKMNMSVTAEGVETKGHAAKLLSLGCQEAQGYLYARPRPAREIEELWVPKVDDAA